MNERRAAQVLAQLPGPLLQWYRQNARQMPWRATRDAYSIWISEIMLQQTRVEAATPYYLRFLQAFPTVQALAAAPEEQVLKLWEGLGYYSRAKNLHRAAKMVAEQYGGNIPKTAQELLKLPGVGQYTAGAVASIAFHQAVAAVDGNVMRVLARLCAEEEEMHSEAARSTARVLIERYMPKDAPGDYNQALMELGATVCLPNGAPLCESCPGKELCHAAKEGDPQRFPVKPEKKQRRQEEYTALVVFCGERLALRQRPTQGLLAGMWEPVMLPGRCTLQEAQALVQSWGLCVDSVFPLADARHVFTHVEWQLHGVRIDAHGDCRQTGIVWADAHRRETLPVPSAYRGILRQCAELKKRR